MYFFKRVVLGIMEQNRNRSKIAGIFRDFRWLPFLIGLAGFTQIKMIGSIGIAELAMCLVFPYVFIKNISLFRRDGMMPVLGLCFLWVCGALYSDFYNDNFFEFAIRGVATPIVTLANLVCLYPILRRNPGAYKWVLVGMAISGVISIFIFQRGVAGMISAETGDFMAGAENAMEYKLFWTNQIGTWTSLPIKGWYMSMSPLYIIICCSLLAVVELLDASRSALLVTVLSLVMMLIAGNTRFGIRKLRRHFFWVAIALAISAYGVKAIYKYSVEQGLVDESEIQKYEDQTKRGTGILDMLIAGRVEFFVGMRAMLDHPVIGLGSHALDKYGYMFDFVSKYGDAEDMRRLERRIELRGGIQQIPFHSHIATYWMWHGIFAGLFWLYVIFLTAKTFVRKLDVYPPLFGYFAMTLPLFFWDVLFSPYGNRVYEATMICLCVIVFALDRNDRLGRIDVNDLRWKGL